MSNTNIFGDPIPGREALIASRDSLILSASGWRKVFAADGDEESTSRKISAADALLISFIGRTFYGFLTGSGTGGRPVIALGTDSRPTGRTVSEILCRALLAFGADVRPLSIVAAPEIMAYVRAAADIDAFAYVTASHNPIGHNGFKFGLSDGSVIGGEGSARLIGEFKAGCEIWDIGEIALTVSGVTAESVARITARSPEYKADAAAGYASFSLRVLADSADPAVRAALLRRLTPTTSAAGIGIVADMNGSARALSIDGEFLGSLGAEIEVINGKAGEIAHRIVPEGISLEPCREALERAHARDPRFILGYLPDNDGDRGNIVYFDEGSGRAETLEAQEVFSLVVLAELAYSAWSGTLGERAAVVVNGPTSMRIEAIAEAFGARVFRCEVGEANVVNRGRELRREGRTVRVMGEGSNGGNITYPSEVRDPLNTLGSLLKLLSVRSASDPGLFELWCRRSGRAALYRPDFTLADVIATLPRFITTSAYEERAKMRIISTDHAVLKRRYEEAFPAEWERRRAELGERFGIAGYEERQYEGTAEIVGEGPGSRSGRETGGLKIVFTGDDGKPVGYIWMRGSGTEPVFRILADIEGDRPEAEAYLLDWQRGMIERADGVSRRS